MIDIATLEEHLGFPLQLCAGRNAAVPAEVAAYVSAAEAWHLIAWHDQATGVAGLTYKGEMVLLDRSKLESLSAEFMRPAKGRGWVALEAKLSNQPVPVPLLQCMYFNEAAVAWLVQRQQQFERLFGRELQVNDHGSDY